MIVPASDCGRSKEKQSSNPDARLLILLDELEQTILEGRKQLLTGNFRQLEQVTDQEVSLHKAIAEDLIGGHKEGIDPGIEPQNTSKATTLKLARSILTETRLQQSLLGRFQQRIRLLDRAATDLTEGYAEVVGGRSPSVYPGRRTSSHGKP